MGLFSAFRPDRVCSCGSGKIAAACRCTRSDKGDRETFTQGQYRNGRKVGNHAGRVDPKRKRSR